MSDIKVDYKEVEQLGKEFRQAMIVSIGRLGERLYQHLRAEVPKVTTNLQQGVAQPDVDEANLIATVTVSARSARTGGGTGTLHLASGKTRTVKLRPTLPFNYAFAVAKGRPAISPKRGKALLIEVAGVQGGNYITANDKVYVVRKSAGAVAPNPYDERAARKLEGESDRIVGKVFEGFFN